MGVGLRCFRGYFRVAEDFRSSGHFFRNRSEIEFGGGRSLVGTLFGIEGFARFTLELLMGKIEPTNSCSVRDGVLDVMRIIVGNQGKFFRLLAPFRNIT